MQYDRQLQQQLDHEHDNYAQLNHGHQIADIAELPKELIKQTKTGRAITRKIIQHEMDKNNPHKVTDDQVGKNEPKWNADRIMGTEIDTKYQRDGFGLVYSGKSKKLEYYPVTYEGFFDHDKLKNYKVKEHAELNDEQVSKRKLWSSSKVSKELATKSDKKHEHKMYAGKEELRSLKQQLLTDISAIKIPDTQPLSKKIEKASKDLESRIVNIDSKIEEKLKVYIQTNENFIADTVLDINNKLGKKAEQNHIHKEYITNIDLELQTLETNRKIAKKANLTDIPRNYLTEDDKLEILSKIKEQQIKSVTIDKLQKDIDDRANWNHRHKIGDIVNLISTLDDRYVNITGGIMTGDLIVPDEAYGVGWDSSLEVPTKNALYDKIDQIDIAINVTIPTTYLKLDASNDPITGNLVITPSTSVTGLTINAAASSIGQVIKANATTPSDLLQFQNSSGAIAGFQGRGTLYSHLGTSDSNLILGKDAGNTTMTGTNNVYIGESSGSLATDAAYNVALGRLALQNVTTGSFNVAIGRGAAASLNTGEKNFALGYLSLANITNQSNNTGIGVNAGRYGTHTGSTIVGTDAGISISGVANIFIGATAAGEYNAVLKTGIDYNIVVGYGAAYKLGTGCDNNTIIGPNAAYNMTTGNGNILIGLNAGHENLANSNLFVGQNAGYYTTTGAANVALGNAALYKNTTASNNVAMGNSSMYENLTGTSDVAIGVSTLSKSTDASYCLAIGAGALQNATTSYNTALGAQTLTSATSGVRNSAFCYGALQQLTTGGYNTAIGMLAGQVTNGSRNTYVGYYSGQSATGSDCVMLGYQSGLNETGNNKLYIANSSTTTPLIYGEFDTPVLKIYGSLVVNEDGNSAYDVRFESDTESNMLFLDANADTDGALYFGGSTNAVKVNKGGDLTFIGSGSGLPFGSMYNDNADYTVTISGAGVDTEIDGGFTVGSLNMMTFPDDHYLLVEKAGYYEIHWSVSALTASVANKTIEGAIMVNGTRNAQGTAHAEVSPGGSGRPETISGHAILLLAVNDQISLCVHNHDDGTDIVVNHASMTVLMVGA